MNLSPDWIPKLAEKTLRRFTEQLEKGALITIERGKFSAFY
jgi:phage terminase small subunit